MKSHWDWDVFLIKKKVRDHFVSRCNKLLLFIFFFISQLHKDDYYWLSLLKKKEKNIIRSRSNNS